MQVKRRVLGEEHHDTLTVQKGLAAFYADRDRRDEALPLLVAAVESARRTLGEDHPETGGILRDYGACLMALERYEEAETILLEAHDILEATGGPSHSETLKAVGSLADLYEATGETPKADEYRRLLPEPEEPPPTSPS